MDRHKKNSKKKGLDFEKKIERTINSGALSFDKGDLKSDKYLVDCKFTEKKGFRITHKMLEKIWNEALESNKLPRLIIGIKGVDYEWILDVSINRKIK